MTTTDPIWGNGIMKPVFEQILKRKVLEWLCVVQVATLFNRKHVFPSHTQAQFSRFPQATALSCCDAAGAVSACATPSAPRPPTASPASTQGCPVPLSARCPRHRGGTAALTWAFPCLSVLLNSTGSSKLLMTPDASGVKKLEFPPPVFQLLLRHYGWQHAL